MSDADIKGLAERLRIMDALFPKYKRNGMTGGDFADYTKLCAILGVKSNQWSDHEVADALERLSTPPAVPAHSDVRSKYKAACGLVQSIREGRGDADNDFLLNEDDAAEEILAFLSTTAQSGDQK